MSYISNTSVTLDSILTRKGREALAKGTFNITQFSLSDDEINYNLYNPNHPSGSAFYGELIENSPLLEAFPDETQMMKYKLLSLPRGTAKLPVLNIGYSSISLRQGATLAITPQTLNYLGQSSTFESSGYSATIGDVRTMSSFIGVGIDTPSVQQLNSTQTSGTNVSKTVVGTTINMTATTVNTLFGSNSQLQTILTITGLSSGARLSIPITIIKVTS